MEKSAPTTAFGPRNVERKNEAYSVTNGLIIDFSISGIRISHNPSLNLLTYGREFTPEDLLSGRVAPPIELAVFTQPVDAMLIKARGLYEAKPTMASA